MLFALCLQLNAGRWGVSLARLLVHSLTLVNLCLASSLPYEGLLRTCSSRGTVPPPSTSLLLVLYIFAGFCSRVCTDAQCWSLLLSSFPELEKPM